MLADLFRAQTTDPFGPGAAGFSDFAGPAVAAGVPVTQESARTLLTVFSAQTFIANMISTLPVGVFSKVDGMPKERVVPGWVENPNPEADRVTFVVQSVLSWLNDGNVFAHRGGNLEARELWALDPTAIHVSRKAAGLAREYRDPYGRILPSVIHVPAMILPGQLRGMSPIEQARQHIGLSLAAVEHGARLFGNGAHPHGVIEAEGDGSEAQAKLIKATWGRGHNGKNAHLPGVLFNAKFKPTTITPEQSQFLETRKWGAAEVCSLYGLDPSWLSIPVEGSQLTYANLEQRSIYLIQVTLLPWIIRLERLFTSLLPRPQYLKFNVAGLLRADTLTRYQAYALGLNPEAPFITVDQIRDWEEWGPMPDPGPDTEDSDGPV